MRNKKNKHKKYFLIGIILIGLLALCVLLFATRVKEQPAEPTLRVGYSLWQGHLPLYVAYERGFFKEEGLNVKLINVGTNYQELIDGVIGGRIDIGLGIFAQTMNIEAEHPGTIYAFHLIGETQNQSGVSSAVLTLKNNSINSIYDLEGKRVGVSNYIDEIYINTILNDKNIKVSDIIRLDRKVILSALASNKIDAIYTTHADTIANAENSLNIKLIEKNVRAKYFGDPFWRTSSICLTKFAHEHPEELKRYMRAIDKAIDLIERDKERRYINPILVKYMPTLDNQTVKTVGIDKFAKSTDDINMIQLNKTIMVLYKNKVLKGIIDPKAFILSYSDLK